MTIYIFLFFHIFNPIALRKKKIVNNFGLSECSRVNIFTLYIFEIDFEYRDIYNVQTGVFFFFWGGWGGGGGGGVCCVVFFQRKIATDSDEIEALLNLRCLQNLIGCWTYFVTLFTFRGPGFDTRSGNILSFLLSLFQEGQLSVTGESMCTKYWLTA